ncbi:MAG TPA: hypothetical protein PKL97_03460 [Candidatus Omnitrophota bacterium]|nr:hypothetical protein [Candidatus Omnitrophota bacterium]
MKGKKFYAVLLAVLMTLLPLQGELFAAATVITATGTVTGVSTFSAPLKLVATNGASSAVAFPAATTGYAKGDSYIDVTFNDNSIGFQAITIATDNRNASANPKYTGIGLGNGLVGMTDKNSTVPAAWMVNPTLVTGGYTFTGAAGEYFVTDTLQGTRTDNDPALGASMCNDANKNKVCNAGEYTDLNSNSAYDKVIWQFTGTGNGASDPAKSYRCQNKTTSAIEYFADGCPSSTHNVAPVEGTDWEGDGWDGAKPYDAGYASVVFGISGQTASLSSAAGATLTPDRTVANGNVKVYLGVKYTGADAQSYQTSRLLIDLVTIS